MLDEGDAAGAHQEREHRVRLLGADARHLGREVELAERGIDRADRLAFEVSHGGADVLVAGLVIGTDEERALDAFVGHVLADRCGPIVVRERRHEAIRQALLARELQRPRQRADREHAGVAERLPDRDHGVGGAEAGDEIDLGLVDQLGGALHRLGRVGLVVDHRQFDRQGAELVAELLERELGAAPRLGAGGRDRPAQRRNEPELDLIGRLRSGGGHEQQERGQDRSSHRCFLRSVGYGLGGG